ncbi:MAG: NirA family protein [Verrucomicrobia bacterium]|nr:NirA family protein [Verrucomicrobiota bacterium]
MPASSINTEPAAAPFTPAQKEYLQGFMAGAMASGAFPFVGTTGSGQLTASPAAATSGNLAASAEATVYGTPIEDLCKEERWKHDENPLDAWERILHHAQSDKAPDAEHNYRFRTHGIFYVAPTQDSYMVRLRIPAGELSSHQLRGLASIADDLGGDYSHITTRANLQMREFKPRSVVELLTRVQDLGLTARGAGADNIRNITASPDSGFAPHELIDVRPHARALHHYIINNRDLYGLPRKFNVAFDNGSLISAAADTNDIGFFAVKVTEASLDKLSSSSPSPLASGSDPNPATGLRPLASGISPGIYFRVQLGGITGHGDFARDTGLLIKPSEAVAVAAAMIRVFRDHGNRTDRKKARLKYLLADWGVEKFLEETAKRLAFPLVRLPLAACEPRHPVDKHGWLGPRRQAQPDLYSVGIGVPVGRLSSKQMRALAELSERYGSGELRLTVWQSLIIPHVPTASVDTVCRAAKRMGCYTEASLAAGGIIACTGSAGCKYGQADTKASATALLKHLGTKFPELDHPLNIHFTGCANSCAQHYCGDLGFIGAKLADGSAGYCVILGGGMDQEQGIGREIFRNLSAAEITPLVDRILSGYLARRERGETFVQWSRRHSVKELQEFFSS